MNFKVASLELDVCVCVLVNVCVFPIAVPALDEGNTMLFVDISVVCLLGDWGVCAVGQQVLTPSITSFLQGGSRK